MKKSSKQNLFFKWLFGGNFVRKFCAHFKEFPYIWFFLIILFLTAWLIAPSQWHASLRVVGITLSLITALLLVRPMNAVYGLMGTSGSIPMFFFNFLFITLLFAGIYHLAFFSKAGISYDVNQPHIDFSCYVDGSDSNRVRVNERSDTLYFERQIDTFSFSEHVVSISRDTLHYQPISFGQVWRSSILTTLTQEPADLFTAASVNNSGIKTTDATLDKQKSALFEWILIFHIIISWIFFGVFISLLYNKFRYES